MGARRHRTVPLTLATLLTLAASVRAVTAPLRSLDDLHAQLTARRHAQIERLHSYAATGRFPRNLDFPGQLVPYFVDAYGTACAVGRLAQLDGLNADVAHIAATNNHIRIADVHAGPLLDWILDSGLTQAECALIQPSYACIEDYRRGRQWQDELTRLRRHFERVEKQLRTDEQRSLEQAMMRRVDAELKRNPKSPALDCACLADALASPEPAVRCAAAYALSRINPERTPREPRIAALLPNLNDPDPAVRFWTAVAIERLRPPAQWESILPPPQPTLSIFLQTIRGERNDLRLAAFIQMTVTAFDCINTSQQVRELVAVRRALVDAASDKDDAVRAFARHALSCWSWQRIVGESRRMRKHYLNDSFELECLAADTLIRSRGFADPPPAVKQLRANFHAENPHNTVLIMPTTKFDGPIRIADTPAEAAKFADAYFRLTYGQQREQENPATWKIESAKADPQRLYNLVTAWRTDLAHGPKHLFIVPQPTMVRRADHNPHSWFEPVHPGQDNSWPGPKPGYFKPRANIRVILGDVARNDADAFTSTCDLFASFMTYYALVIIDRDVKQSDDRLQWSGRFANLRKYAPRFGQGGVGSSTFGGGGWDFHRFTFTCDRASGELTLAAEPIEFRIEPAHISPEQIAWETEELRLMGWRPLKSIEFYGDALFPPEYHQVVAEFDANSPQSARQLVYRSHHFERSLPVPELFLGLLFDEAGHRETSAKLIAEAGDDQYALPQTLVDVARWEFAAGLNGAARKHAQAAVKLWPENPVAAQILHDLGSRDSLVEDQ